MNPEPYAESVRDLKLAAAAAERRERMRIEANICDCYWPVRVFRNLTGHDPACPAHAWKAEHSDGEA